MTRFATTFVLLILLTAIAPASWGQSVYWAPIGGTLQEGKVNRIELTFESCRPDGQPRVPEMPDLSLTLRDTASSTSIVNGRTSSKVIYTYQATPSGSGAVTIPSFTVATNAGPQQVPEARFEIVEATVGNTGLRPNEIFLTRFQIDDDSIYEGEVFDITYLSGAKASHQLVDLSAPAWQPRGLVTSGLKETQSGSLDWQGDRYNARAYEAKAMATQAGSLDLPGASQTATIVVGQRRDFLFSEPIVDTFNLEVDGFSLEVKPLPSGAPETFAGAVGQFELDSRVVPQDVQVGEPITWTLELSGSGNWPSGIGVPSRNASTQFRAIQPEVRNEFDPDNLFLGKQTEDIVLIPTEEGEYTLGPMEYSYFDPATESYKTLSIPAQTVTVLPGSSPARPETFEPSEPLAVDDSLDRRGVNVATQARSLPREPALGRRLLPVPTGSISLLPAGIAAIGAPVGLWALLALARVVRQDPNRPRRQARRQLKALLQQPMPADPAKIAQLQREWRDGSRRYWALDTQEPSAAEIQAAARSLSDEEVASKWKEIWLKSDRLLYSRNQGDPEAWRREAAETLAASPKSGRSLRGFWSRGAWVVLAVSTFAALHPTAALSQSDPHELYLQGDFAAAAAQWKSVLSEEPQVWEHRYNLGLALAQQDNWGEAWAYWAGAFCLDPSDERLRWNLKLAQSRTDAYDPTLGALIDGDGLYRIVGWRSPAAWERLALYSVLGGGIALCLAVITRYIGPLRRGSVILLSAGCLLILSAFFCQWCHAKYGPLALPHTALLAIATELKSIPTDLPSDQIAASIGEGAVASVRKAFLAWRQIELPNGDIGWVRQETLVPLYGSALAGP